MVTFKEKVSFYLASLGLSATETAQVLADTRVAFEIKSEDVHGVRDAILFALYQIEGDRANLAFKTFNDPRDKVMLTILLTS